jgi:hypothetical protein
LLGNGAINTHCRTTEEKCFLWSPSRGTTEAGSCRSTEEYKEYNRVKWRTRVRMERVLVICEVGRLAIAL